MKKRDLSATAFTLVPSIPDSHKEVYHMWLEKAKTDPAVAGLVNLIEWHLAEQLSDTQTDLDGLNNLADKPEDESHTLNEAQETATLAD